MKTRILSCWILLALLAASCPALAAEVALETWVHRYHNTVTNANDQAFKIVTDAHGDVIVTGSTDNGITGVDTLTIKYSGADGSVLWSQRYNGPANLDDQPTAITTDTNGDVMVTGSSYHSSSGFDCFTAKYAGTSGVLLWEQSYNGSANSDDQPTAIATDTNGDVVVTGSSYHSSSGFDYFTAKYAGTSGVLLWEKRYNGPANEYDSARTLAVDSRGNVVVTGWSVGPGFNYDYYTAKYAVADGALLWERRYNGPVNGDDRAMAVAMDINGNVVVTGSSYNANDWDHYTAKYAAADGALLWEHRYNGPANEDDRATALAIDADGNVVVTGYSSSSNRREWNSYAAKYAADGAFLWEQRFGPPFGVVVAVDASGNVVVTGTASGGSANYTAKYAATSGALLWEKRHDGGPNIAGSLVVDASGNVVVTGTSSGDFYTAKYAVADGALLWEQRYNGPLRLGDGGARAAAVDPSGDVVVTGTSAGDYYTAKYAATSGALLWEQRYNGPANGDDQPIAVAVDARGNVVVTGTSSGDFHTAKYAARDGALLWEQRYNGPANDWDQATALAVDTNGNVVVTGSSVIVRVCGPYGVCFTITGDYTAKYAGEDGTLLWERRYEGPVRLDDAAQAVAVDASGNVVITGWSVGTNFNYDYYTVKYAAADGALLWEQRYNGPSDGLDYAQAVAVDPSGNVVVTGTSQGDYYTAKYAAADGALLWEQRYNGWDNNFDEARAVVVDANGNAVVTGYSVTVGNCPVGPCIPPLRYQKYTAKYAASDGTLLWERWGYDGKDKAQAVAVDSSGNVVVTGDRDGWYYTAMYDASVGATMWEQSYQGPAGSSNFIGGSHALALGSDGSVVITGTSSGDFATVKYVTYPTPIVLSLAISPEGARLRFTGDAGRTYRLQRASNPAGPWSTFTILSAPPSGLVEHLDPTPLASPAFYRIAAP